MDGLDLVVARRLRAVLDEEKLRREDLARAMSGIGFRWTANRVTQVVTERRPLSLLELAGVCSVLRRPLDDFLAGAGEIELPSGSVDLADVRSALEGDGAWEDKRAALARMSGAYAEHTEATIKAARRLNVSPGEVDAAARCLWGHMLADERDRRVAAGADDTTRTLQARRGHVTRALVDELREHFQGAE